MVINLFSHSSNDRCGCPRSYEVTPAPPGQVAPPKLHQIRRMTSTGDLTVCEITWPEAKNYEGRKVLVFQASVEQLTAAMRLDPHFCEARGPLVPIARFEPTERGWMMALRFAVSWEGMSFDETE